MRNEYYTYNNYILYIDKVKVGVFLYIIYLYRQRASFEGLYIDGIWYDGMMVYQIDMPWLLFPVSDHEKACMAW